MPLEKQFFDKRNSGIDLLRIIAMLLICIFHATQTFSGQYQPEGTFTKEIVNIFGLFGSIGNIIFIICSSYFLADKTKARPEKAINILADSSLISITILLAFLLCKVQLERSTIIHQIVPDIYQQNWFVPCYVVFYLLAPIVTTGLKNLSKNAHFAVCVVSILTYGILTMYESTTPVGSHLLSFFYILNIVTFLKWYVTPKSSRWNFMLFFFGFILFYVLTFSVDFLGKKFNFPTIGFASYYSPFFLFPLIGLFNIFRNMKFNCRFISYLGTCTLFVYIIHENYLLRTITRKTYYRYVIERFGIKYALAFILLCGITIFIVSFILSVIYNKTLHKLTKKLSVLIVKYIKHFTDKLFLIFVK